MTRLTTSVAVDIGPLWVTDEVLGQSLEFERDGFRIVIPFPPAPQQGPATPPFDGSSQDPPDGKPRRRGMKQILVRLYWDHPGPVDFGGPSIVEIPRAIGRARQVALQVAREFVDWTRVMKHQVWLPEHLQELGYQVSGGAANDETGEDLRLVVPEWPRFIDQPEGTEFDRAFLGELAAALAEAREVPLPERFLADALYLVLRKRAADVQRAVILAAIATELKVKAVLRGKATADAIRFIDIIVDNPRDVSVAVIELFHKTMKATTGRSLREEDASLFAGVRRLFEIRNAIVHTGTLPEVERGEEAVKAARSVFDWLDSI